MRLAISALALSLLVGPLSAQREPVLQQIHVPHNYYYREMYLPQVTSGPSSVAWSPDGKTLIYSMQGSLWRQRLGTTRAEQVTDGDGYDYQPDWSPDGDHVVYASYRKDAVQLWLLDTHSLATTLLLADSAVNVEPRWSPDGTRIAFVSTSYQGRWHVYVATLRGDHLEGIERLTKDRDSGLPRYYYSKYDHYLSPTWSPDGKELLIVSNRNHIWGSGGLWRIPSAPAACGVQRTACTVPGDSGGGMRQVRYEETTWKARPDWSRDGQRIVYSSYLGRQWNQLWLMPSDGGDPLQLTYGEFDATDPRWSPDGTAIAYISNEGGNTSLRVVQVPGGETLPVNIERRIYRHPVGRVRIQVIDPATHRPMPARVSVTLPDGRSLAPDDAWRFADDGFVRSERAFEYGYFHSTGTSSLTAPVGPLRVEVSHGPEYEIVRRSVTVPRDGVETVRVSLRRLTDLGSSGWTSGDLHVHMNYGGHYRATPSTLAQQASAEGLSVVENLIVNKEGRVPDVGYFTGRVDPISSSHLLIAHDQEFHTSYWGHTGVIGLTQHLLLPGYAAYVNTPAASLYPDNATVADMTHAQGGLFGYVHPFDEYPEPTKLDVPLTTELPVDVALGKVDYYEVMGFSDHLASARVWYQLLNCGFRIPAGAGTDAMTNFASLRGPVGTVRVYVHSGFPLDHRRWLNALKAGQTFVTNGPLLGFSSGTTGIGGELRLAQGQSVPFHVSLRSYVPVDHLEIVANGEVVAAVPLTGDRRRADTTVSIPVGRSGWYTLRAWNEKPMEPILDLYPFSTTSPIYLTVAGAPVRSTKDAEYFLAWIQRLEGSAMAFANWNSETEKAAVLGHIRAAREEFNRRAGR